VIENGAFDSDDTGDFYFAGDNGLLFTTRTYYGTRKDIDKHTCFFVNARGDEVLTLDFGDLSFECGPFQDGLSVLRLIGKDGLVYTSMIDEQGNLCFDPVPFEAASPCLSSGRALVQSGSEYGFLDSAGNFTASETLTRLFGLYREVRVGRYSEGWMAIQFKDSSNDYCFFNFSPSTDSLMAIA